MKKELVFKVNIQTIIGIIILIIFTAIILTEIIRTFYRYSYINYMFITHLTAILLLWGIIIICIFTSHKLNPKLQRTLDQFNHVETIQKPTILTFTTKDGKLIRFPATKIIRKPTRIKFPNLTKRK